MFGRFWQRNGWTPFHAVAAIVLTAMGIGFTRDAWGDMFLIAANDPEASHVFLAWLIAPWLVWVRRDRLRYCVPRGHWVGSAIVLLGWAISSYGYYRGYQSLWHGGTVMIAVGCIVTAIGVDALRKFFPAFAVLIFLVPMPQSLRHGLALPLQNVLAEMTWWSFDLVGVNVEQMGNTVMINGELVRIVEACNGLRMVFTLVLVTYAVAFSLPLKWYVRALLLAMSPVFALISNFIRMIPTVWVFGNYPREPAEQFHNIAGWVMLFIAFFALLGLVKLMRWAMIPVTRYTLAYDR